MCVCVCVRVCVCIYIKQVHYAGVRDMGIAQNTVEQAKRFDIHMSQAIKHFSQVTYRVLKKKKLSAKHR